MTEPRGDAAFWEEYRSVLSRLWALVHSGQVTTQEPASLNGAVLLLRWAGVEYFIDGRRSINAWQRHGVTGPHRALVLERIK